MGERDARGPAGARLNCIADLEVHVLQIGPGHTLRDIEDLQAHDLTALVKIDDESRP